MKRLIFLATSALLSMAATTQYPSPTFNNASVLGNHTINGNLTVAGAATLIGGGNLSGTFSGPLTINNLRAGLLPTSTVGLASIASPVAGDMVYVTDCVNGSQSSGSGCPAFYNANNQWVPMPTPTTLGMTIGGQTIQLGGSTTNRGNGTLLQTGTGATTSGDCAQFNSTGALIDSGAPCSGGTGGGGGTVTAGPQFAMSYYSASGTSNTVSAMSIVSNAVLVTSSSGVPSESTTLPAGLNIPNAAISNGNFTGTTTLSTVNYTGKQTFSGSSTTAASINIPPGVAPNSPVNGDIWETTAGLFGRVNGTTVGPLVATVNTSGPLGGGGAGPILTLTCTTCATTTNGGALTATLPVSISAAGVIALGNQTFPLTWDVDSAYVVHNDTYPFIERWPDTNSGSLKSVIYHTGSASFTITFQICTGGVSGTCTTVPSCSSLNVSSATDVTATCGTNSIGPNQTLEMVISGVTGTPSSAAVQAVITKPAS